MSFLSAQQFTDNLPLVSLLKIVKPLHCETAQSGSTQNTSKINDVEAGVNGVELAKWRKNFEQFATPELDSEAK